MHEPVVPAYYVVSRDADLSENMHFLSFTPILCCLITDQLDFTLAKQYCDEVILTQSPHTIARHINEQTGRCLIIISDHQETIYANKEIEEEVKAS
jgi:hypothetical protein